MLLILFVFALSIVFSACAVWGVLKFSHRKKWYDQIDDRKVHSGEVPRLGGIGFVTAFFVMLAGLSLFFKVNGIEILPYAPCAAAMFIILVSGAFDDFRPLPPYIKIMLQFIATIIVVIFGFNLERLLYTGGGILTNLGILRLPVTFLWIVGMTNAVNLIDGVDGLAGGSSAISAFFLASIFFSFSGASKAVLLCTALIGVLMGFLIFNAPFPKAKIFMGDCGSQFLGFTLALIPLMKDTYTNSSLPVFYLAAFFVVPIFDTIAAVWRRIRDNKKIYEPDKSHLHHKLMNLGLNGRQIIILIFTMQIIVGVLTFIAVRTAEQGVVSLIYLGCAYFIALAFFAAVHFMNRVDGIKKTEVSKLEENTPN